MPQKDILDVLPVDVLALVLNESQKDEPRKFSSLRLVCKAINEIVEPQTFSVATITLTYTWESIDPICDKLTNMAAGNSPHSRWAKELHVKHLYPVAYERLGGYGGVSRVDGDRISAFQSKYLVPAIKSLVHAQTASFTCHDWEPYNDILLALSELPRLRNLDLTLTTENLGTLGICLGRFPSLTTVKIKFYCSFSGEIVKNLIEGSPSIADLDIHRLGPINGRGNPSATTLSTIVEDALKSSTFSPTVRRLGVAQDYIVLTPSCIPFLHALTHLYLHDDSTAIEPSFWTALQDNHIHLQGLTVSPMSQRVVDYLLSYTGLQEFSLAWPEPCDLSEPVDDARIAHQFFHSVIPLHRKTMKVISFECIDLWTWWTTERFLNQLLLCDGLEKIKMIYYAPGQAETMLFPVIPMGHFLSSISQHFPKLRDLTLWLGRKFPSLGWDDGHAYYHLKMVYGQFANIISEGICTSKRLPSFTISAVGASFTAKAGKHPGQYHFETEEISRIGCEYGIYHCDAAWERHDV